MTSADAAEASRQPRPAAQLPEPGRFWIRYTPRAWDTPELPWVHLAAGKLGDWIRRGARGAASASVTIAAFAENPLDDVLYLPPVAPKRAAARDDLARTRLVDGTPVLVQLFPGEESTIPAVNGVAFVVDLLSALLDRDLDRLARVPAGAAAVWPLIPALTDDAELWEEGCGRLAAAGVRCVQPIAPDLSPADRRRLFDEWGNDDLFEALFHRDARSERDFARAAHRHGLVPFLPRPIPRAPIQGRENREAGGLLALAADLWMRLGRTVEPGQALYRAARWADETSYDLEGLAREGNLGVLPALDERSREVVMDWAETGESSLVAELLAEYVSQEEPP